MQRADEEVLEEVLTGSCFNVCRFRQSNTKHEAPYQACHKNYEGAFHDHEYIANNRSEEVKERRTTDELRMIIVIEFQQEIFLPL